MKILLKSAVIHGLDSSLKMPILSNQELLLSDVVSDYISGLIENVFGSDDIKTCFFRPESELWAQCQRASWEPVIISQSVAEEMFTIMLRNPEIPSAHIVAGVVNINDGDYFYLLKLDYRQAFTHALENSVSGQVLNIVVNTALLPPSSTKVNEAFFVDMASPQVRVCEKRFSIDGAKEFYISSQILGCSEVKSPRQKATKLIQVAEKIGNMYYTESDDISVHISETVYNELKETKTLPVKKLGQEFFPHNPVAQNEFYERLALEEIDKSEILSLSEKFQKKYEKRAIRSSSGVEIKIPTLLYSNTDEIEFLNNPDGTFSILIKNIKL